MNTKINCDEQGRIFNGITACGDYNTGDYVMSFVSKKMTGVPDDATFLTKFIEGIRKNQILPFDAWDYRNAHEDNQVSTTALGKEYLERLGKPKFEIDVKVSIGQSKEVSKINNSPENWDLWHLFENALICTTKANGDFKGFDLALLHAETTRLKQSGEKQMKTLKAQLNSNVEYNERMTLIPLTDELQALKESKGIVPLNVVVVITDATHLSVTITDASTGNGIAGVTDVDMYQFLGKQATPSTIDTVVSVGNGVYTLTLDSALITADTVGVKIAETGFESIDIDGVYYGGSSDLVVKS